MKYRKSANHRNSVIQFHFGGIECQIGANIPYLKLTLLSLNIMRIAYIYEWTLTPRRASDFPIWHGLVHQIQLIIPTCWLFLLIIVQCTMLYGFTRRLTSKPKHKGANYENQIHTAQSICKFNATLAFGFYGSETAKTCQSKIVHLHFLHFVYDLFGAEKIDFLKIEEKKKTILLTPEKISVCIFGTDTKIVRD